MAFTPKRPRAWHTPPPPLTLVCLGREEINPDAMDHVVMRLFTELVRQLSIEEDIKPDDLKASHADRERHARILVNLERILERLANLEVGRAAARMSRVQITDGNARRAIEARIDRIIEAELTRANFDSAE
jgi:hypothetical protein